MSRYKEGQQVNTPQGEGRVAADQINKQVYVSLTESESVEAFDESEIEAAAVPDIPGEAVLPPDEVKSFDFDDFLEKENPDRSE